MKGIVRCALGLAGVAGTFGMAPAIRGQSAKVPQRPNGISSADASLQSETIEPAAPQDGVQDIRIDGRTGQFLPVPARPRLTYHVHEFVRVVVVNVNPFAYRYQITTGDSQPVAEASPAAFLSMAIPGVSVPTGANVVAASGDSAGAAALQGLVGNEHVQIIRLQDSLSALRGNNAGKRGDTAFVRDSVSLVDQMQVLAVNVTRDSLRRELLLQRARAEMLQADVDQLRSPPAQSTFAPTTPAPHPSCPERPNPQQTALADLQSRIAGITQGEAALSGFLARVDGNNKGFGDQYVANQNDIMDGRAGATTVREIAFETSEIVQQQLSELAADSEYVAVALAQLTTFSRRLIAAADAIDTTGCPAAFVLRLDAHSLAGDTALVASRLATLVSYRAQLAHDLRAFTNVWTDASSFSVARTLRRYDQTTDVPVQITRTPLVLAVGSSSLENAGVKSAPPAPSGATTIATTVTTTATIPPASPNATVGAGKETSAGPTAATHGQSGNGANSAGGAGNRGGAQTHSVDRNPGASSGGGSASQSQTNAPTSSTAAPPKVAASTDKGGGGDNTPQLGSSGAGSAPWRDFAIHYQSRSFFTIGVGLAYGGTGAPQYGVARRRFAAPPGAPGDTAVSVIASTDKSGYRVSPVVTLGARFCCGPVNRDEFFSGLHVTIAAGVHPKSGDVTVDYMAGLGISFFDSRLMAVPGVYVGRQNYLLSGVRLGDPASGTAAPTGSRYVAAFGFAITYRVY